MKHAQQKDQLAMQNALQENAFRLHEIESRSSVEQIASEVLRLNDAVRAAAAGRLHYSDHPQDFAAALLANADVVNEEVSK